MTTVSRRARRAPAPSVPLADVHALLDALRADLEEALRQAPDHAGLARTLGILDAVVENGVALSVAEAVLRRGVEGGAL